jgi:hypothetical protein
MPTKFPSPLLGYNNNVRHKGKVFHVQTEDSGVKYGHIITHLFMDGGRILKSVKTSYSEYVENDRMGEIVREMMKQQHKAMFIALRDGKFDSMIDDGSKSSPAVEGGPAPPAPSPTPAAVFAKSAARPRAKDPSPPPSAIDVFDETLPPETVRQVPEEMAFDVGAIGRAAAAAQTAASVPRPSQDLPSPPPNLFHEKVATGKYRETTPAAVPRATSGAPAHGAAPKPPLATRAPLVERRYAPTRPASIFGQAKPQQGKSIFGEDLLSDRSLDEVILSYLAEDLDAEPKK